MSHQRLAYNGQIEALRHREFAMLGEDVYLDHAGTTLYPKSLVDRFAADMTSNLFGNPHSASASSQTSMSRIDDIRLAALQFFGADPAEFDLVFVANATAGIKLVAEAFRASPGGFDYFYHQASHTSLVGLREEARNSRCLDSTDIAYWLDGRRPNKIKHGSDVPTLFAYPGQSNMNGERFPLDWPERIRDIEARNPSRVFTLLDVASLAATSPLDLGDSGTAPDFVVLSFYKIFGFPDLGALIVRRQASSCFRNRRYFGGGTVDMVVSAKEQWHIPKTQTLHETLEDGTLPIHSIIALGHALQIHPQLFGSMRDVSLHTGFLAQRLHLGLKSLHHCGGADVCKLYSAFTAEDGCQENGPVVAFNLQNAYGAWVSLAEFEKLAVLKRFHIRTGGLCNPGGIANALGLEPWEMKQNLTAGFRCGTDQDIMFGKPTGVIRISFGAMSTIADVDRFLAFIEEFYVMAAMPQSAQPAIHPGLADESMLYLDQVVVYPIKSCGGYHVPQGVSWEVRPEGLAWDREWCLLHRGTGHALNQKRYPRMALVKPHIDFTTGHLRVTYSGPTPRDNMPCEILVPLSADPKVLSSADSIRSRASQVCGEEIAAQTYISPEINNFFSEILGVPCVLARFPPGGLGKSMRHAKAHLQKHQRQGKNGLEVSGRMPGEFPGVITPPDSDTEREKPRILLSNESPILAINLSSLDTLNRAITQTGGAPVSEEVFRANLVIGLRGSTTAAGAYAEDHWSALTVGQQKFQMMGSCRRCHMVCIDQTTAEKREEPFATLAKTRRFDGKVFFGTHMRHVPVSVQHETTETQYPTVRVGDRIMVD